MIWVSPSRWLKCMPQDRHVWCISSNPSEAKKLKLSSCWLLHSIHRHPHIIWNFLVVNRNIKLESPHINPCPNCAAWILIISEIACNIGYKVVYNARTTTTLLLIVKKVYVPLFSVLVLVLAVIPCLYPWSFTASPALLTGSSSMSHFAYQASWEDTGEEGIIM